ncbi:MAG: 4Fe-4S binding protein, partial [Chloroflexi bacterium]|nr:4Fe-4S binding protein [Chloroflexota bacterium]
RPTWLVALIRAGFPGRFVLAGVTRWPVVGKALQKWLFDGDDLVFLPSDRVVQVGLDVDAPEQVVLPSILVERFINEANYHWVMDNCICRQASHCADYPIGLGCIFLGEAALGINPALGRRVTRDEALEHARKCREAGLVHLIGRNKLDAVWLGVGPGNKLLTICNCCPCCCLWRMLPVVSEDIGATVKKMPGVNVRVTEGCSGCGICAEGVCFVNAISMVNGAAVLSNACRGCGRCSLACPLDAIVVEYSAGAVDLATRNIRSLVDVG